MTKRKADADGRIVALVSGDAALDAPVREAIAQVDPAAAGVEEPSAALEQVGSGDIDLVLVDDQAADPAELHAAAMKRAPGPGPAFVTILGTGGDTLIRLAGHPALAHYVARPFRSETLVALLRTLLEKTRATGTGPAIQLRRPARFSARPLYADAVAYARSAFEAARDGGAPDLDNGRVVAERLHTSLVQGNLLLIRALEPYKRFEIPTHCANVAIVSARIALGLDWPLERTLRLIQAGLVHDIGMARLPKRILEKDGPLDDEERRVMETHPSLGAEILEALGPEAEWLQRAVAEEHERASGQGYPEGLEGDRIDPLARIIGVADVFEAFSHARTYRSQFTAYEALERVMAMRGEHFDATIVDALANEISVFPLDSYVRLSTGSIGRVVATNPDNLMRPTIEVLWNDAWTPLDQPEILALEAAPEITIERPLHESEVPIT